MSSVQGAGEFQIGREPRGEESHVPRFPVQSLLPSAFRHFDFLSSQQLPLASDVGHAVSLEQRIHAAG